ncbi:hypothetical protein SAMN06295912_11291 [Sphingomonas laterariae]|uniref:Uncharacterized protein n=1 Tax=Edaphosphingomonas laterariae TaxID=861865 RepID=A0A239GKB4_9SPHN|nr:hypothetical protein [Sphingomonas laterariae]SNS68923.1 hypothetical protein SAMN06295912_11291 [Sphingomonas laterariae]
MADYFISTAFEIVVGAPDADLLTECFETSHMIACDYFGRDEEGLDAARACYAERSEAFRAAFPPLEEEQDPFAGFLQIWTDPDFPTFDADLSVEDDADGMRKRVFIHGDCADVSAIASVIQATCPSALPFGFEWSTSCSRARPGSRGGGYFVITPYEILGGGTEWLMNEALKAVPRDSAKFRRLPIMTGARAESMGFAPFNDVPTLPVDILDGGFTISARSSEELRVTFHFGPYRTDGPPRFVDIQFHDSGMTVPDGGGAPAPVFDMLTIAEQGRQPYDSRKAAISDKPSIAVLLLDRPGDPD